MGLLWVNNWYKMGFRKNSPKEHHALIFRVNLLCEEEVARCGLEGL